MDGPTEGISPEPGDQHFSDNQEAQQAAAIDTTAAGGNLEPEQQVDLLGTDNQNPEIDPAEAFALPEVWQAMSPEQQARAARLREAIAESGLREYGVTAESLRVVMTEDEEDRGRRFYLIHTGAGIPIGGYLMHHTPNVPRSFIMSQTKDMPFILTVDGETYDTLSGMTSAVYKSKVEDARRRGVTLPDSKELAKETGDVWTWTVLTGGPFSGRLTDDRYVRFGYTEVSGGVREYPMYPMDRDLGGLRVCPAVEIE